MAMTSLGDKASPTEPTGSQWWAVSVDTVGIRETTGLLLLSSTVHKANYRWQLHYVLHRDLPTSTPILEYYMAYVSVKARIHLKMNIGGNYVTPTLLVL